jgi:hypothetical protein
MVASIFDSASDHPAVCARSRCEGISAAYAYPIADAPVVLNVARQAKKICIFGVFVREDCGGGGGTGTERTRRELSDDCV